MSVPTSEVGYTSAMPRREDHEVHKDMWGQGKEKKNIFKLWKFDFQMQRSTVGVNRVIWLLKEKYLAPTADAYSRECSWPEHSG